MTVKKFLVSILLSIVLVVCLAQQEQNNVKAESQVEEKVKAEKKVSKVEVQEKKVKAKKKAKVLKKKKYVKSLKSIIKIYDTSFTKIGGMINEASSNPSLLKDEDWLKKIQLEFNKVEIGLLLLDQIESDGLVPRDFKDTHETLTYSFGLFVVGGDNMIRGYAKSNKVALDDAVIFIEASKSEMSDAKDSIEEKTK